MVKLDYKNKHNWYIRNAQIIIQFQEIFKEFKSNFKLVISNYLFTKFQYFYRRFDFYSNLNLFSKWLFLFLLKEVYELNFTKIV